LNNGTVSNTATISVGGVFSDGATLQDALSGATYNVSGGKVTVTLAARTGAVLLPYPASVDLMAPVSSIATVPATNQAGFSSTPVTVNLSASDTGSGISQLRYWVNDGPTTVVAGSTATFNLTTTGMYAITVRAVDNAGNISAASTKLVRIVIPQGRK
jgi:hypothetical protein